MENGEQTAPKRQNRNKWTYSETRNNKLVEKRHFEVKLLGVDERMILGGASMFAMGYLQLFTQVNIVTPLLPGGKAPYSQFLTTLKYLYD